MLISGDEIVDYFTENYGKEWIAYFNNKKSIKSLWKTINDIGINQLSLSTLYSHHKMNWFSREKYINDLVQIQNIDKIMIILNLQDDNIEKALPNALKIYRDKEKADFNIAYAAWRKKIGD